MNEKMQAEANKLEQMISDQEKIVDKARSREFSSAAVCTQPVNSAAEHDEIVLRQEQERLRELEDQLADLYSVFPELSKPIV
jgi:hypothetical protein